MCARRLPWWRKELHLLESSTQATPRSNLGSKSSAHFLAIPIKQLYIPLLQPSQQSSKRTPTCRICAQQPVLRRYSTNTASSIFGGGLPVGRYPPPPQHFPGLPWALLLRRNSSRVCRGFQDKRCLVRASLSNGLLARAARIRSRKGEAPGRASRGASGVGLSAWASAFLMLRPHRSSEIKRRTTSMPAKDLAASRVPRLWLQDRYPIVAVTICAGIMGRFAMLAYRLHQRRSFLVSVNGTLLSIEDLPL